MQHPDQPGDASGPAKKPPRNWFFPSLVGGLLAGMLLPRLYRHGLEGLGSYLGTMRPWLAPLAMLLALPAAGLQVIVHKLGHALAARVMGGTVFRIVIGPWRYEHFRSGWRWHRQRALKGIAGLAHFIVPGDQRFRTAMTLTLLGGATANLLLAGLASWFWQYREAPLLLRIVCLELTVFGLIFGLLNLWPWRRAGFHSDGFQVWSLWTNAALCRQGAQMMRIAGASLAGRRPREIDPAELVGLDAEGLQGSPRLAALLVPASVKADRGDISGARELLAIAMAEQGQYADGMRQSIPLMAAEFAANVDRDPQQARRLLQAADGGLFDSLHTAFVELRIADLEGELRRRDQLLLQVQTALEDSLFLGDVRVYREQLDAWLQEWSGGELEHSPGADFRQPHGSPAAD